MCQMPRPPCPPDVSYDATNSRHAKTCVFDGASDCVFVSLFANNIFYVEPHADAENEPNFACVHFLHPRDDSPPPYKPNKKKPIILKNSKPSPRDLGNPKQRNMIT